jgi:hypothetical protein
MRHPFDGLNSPALGDSPYFKDAYLDAPNHGDSVDQVDDPGSDYRRLESHRSSRRGFVGKLVGFSAAVAAVFGAGGLQAQQGSAARQGRSRDDSSRGGPSSGGTASGDRSPGRSPSGGSAHNGRATTYAVGEEGAGRVTTYALGEEGAGRPPWDGRVTTQAVGEEGAGYPRPWPGATTYALGEEGGHYRPPYYRPPYYGYRPRWWY